MDKVTLYLPHEFSYFDCPHCANAFVVLRIERKGEGALPFLSRICPSCERPLGDTVYAQRDPRWKDSKLGYGDTTIGQYGCVLCSMAMAAQRAWWPELTPLAANAAVEQANGYTGVNGNLMRWVQGGASLGLTFEWRATCNTQPAPVERIMAALEQGHYVLLKVDFDPGSVLNQHWVLVRGKAPSDGALLIDDPWTGKTHEIPPAYCLSGWDLARAVFGVVVYSWDGGA